MQYTSRDYEFLGKQVAEGKYISRTVCVLAVLLALCLGGIIGNLTSSEAVVEQKRPIGQKSQSEIASAVNPNKQLFDGIMAHEEEVRLDPTKVDAWIHLGNLYFDVKEPAKAVNAYNKALALSPDNPAVMVDCGIMYRELKDYSKALELFNAALKIDPKHEFALFNTGVVQYFDLNQKKEGLATWQKLVSINPQAKGPDGKLVSAVIKELPAQ